MTSNDPCASLSNATSNSIAITITPIIPGTRYSDITATPGIPIQLMARSPGINYSYQWNPSVGLNFYNLKAPVFNYDKQTEYLITLTSDIGCITVDTLLVKINTTPSIYVPNAWSPNDDGHNDYIAPMTTNIRQLNYFRIFNRWGQKVFETNVIGVGWNGIFNSKRQPIDVYTWTIEVISTGGVYIKKTGKAILIR